MNKKNSINLRAILAGTVGNAIEWYDFAIYGYFAQEFSKLFFPNASHLVALMAVYGALLLVF